MYRGITTQTQQTSPFVKKKSKNGFRAGRVVLRKETNKRDRGKGDWLARPQRGASRHCVRKGGGSLPKRRSPRMSIQKRGTVCLGINQSRTARKKKRMNLEGGEHRTTGDWVKNGTRGGGGDNLPSKNRFVCRSDKYRESSGSYTGLGGPSITEREEI